MTLSSSPPPTIAWFVLSPSPGRCGRCGGGDGGGGSLAAGNAGKWEIVENCLLNLIHND